MVRGGLYGYGDRVIEQILIYVYVYTPISCICTQVLYVHLSKCTFICCMSPCYGSRFIQIFELNLFERREISRELTK